VSGRSSKASKASKKSFMALFPHDEARKSGRQYSDDADEDGGQFRIDGRLGASEDIDHVHHQNVDATPGQIL